MTAGDSAQAFTETLLQVIRQQRHLAARVIIATQEPTISPKLLDLCSMTIVHRFTSPEWMTALKSHLAGVSEYSDTTKRSVKEVFDLVLQLDVGEALLFSPTAMMEIENGRVQRLGTEFIKMRTRKRVTKDGGKSVMGIETIPAIQSALPPIEPRQQGFKKRAKQQKASQQNGLTQDGGKKNKQNKQNGVQLDAPKANGSKKFVHNKGVDSQGSGVSTT